MPWSNNRPANDKYRGTWPKVRKAWAARHQPTDLCTRCHRMLGPMSPRLHLDHDDVQTDVVRGFAHAGCNVGAAASKANAIRQGKWPSQQVTPLVW